MSYKRLFNVLLSFSLLILLGVGGLHFAPQLQRYLYIDYNRTNGALDEDAYITATGSEMVAEAAEQPWNTFINYDYQYLFRYPAQAQISNIKLKNYINASEDYKTLHTDNICIKLQYNTAWAQIYINPKDPSISKFCGVYEYDSEVEIIRKQIIIDNKTYPLQQLEQLVKDENGNELLIELNMINITRGDTVIKVEYADTGLSTTDLEVVAQIIKTIELI